MTSLSTPAPAPGATAVAGAANPLVRLEGLWHRYPGMGERQATLRGVSLSLRPGELVGLLGPSGCGKTTLLRLIAGFERPWRGSVQIDGREVAGQQRWLPPERRGVGMVFQDYALFPHLDAWGNTCFGLRRGQSSDRAARLLELLGLAELRHRYPHELSGGQRQRLALARALAPGGSLVLLDEPFSNLDVEVRLRLRAELPAVLAECGAGGLMVTHDPEEALAICDRVAVLADGRLHQCASPAELVQEPASAFVGRFLLQANVLPARVAAGELRTCVGALVVAAGRIPEGEALEVLILPEALELEPAADGPARVLGREFQGRHWVYVVECGGERLRVRQPLHCVLPRGSRARLWLRADETARLYPGGLRLRAKE
jgi:iron(III) transport system ATP-binding protein